MDKKKAIKHKCKIRHKLKGMTEEDMKLWVRKKSTQVHAHYLWQYLHFWAWIWFSAVGSRGMCRLCLLPWQKGSLAPCLLYLHSDFHIRELHPSWGHAVAIGYYQGGTGKPRIPGWAVAHIHRCLKSQLPSKDAAVLRQVTGSVATFKAEADMLWGWSCLQLDY